MEIHSEHQALFSAEDLDSSIIRPEIPTHSTSATNALCPLRTSPGACAREDGVQNDGGTLKARLVGSLPAFPRLPFVAHFGVCSPAVVKLGHRGFFLLSAADLLLLVLRLPLHSNEFKYKLFSCLFFL